MRTTDDDVRITDRRTGMRLLSVLLLCAACGIAFLMWSIHRDGRKTRDMVPLLLGLSIPAVVLLLFVAAPGQRLVASKSQGFVEVQRRWWVIPYARRRLHLDEIHHIGVRVLGEKTRVQNEVGGADAVVGLVVGGGAGRAVAGTREVVLRIGAIEIVARDASSLQSLFSRSVDDCGRAVGALWELLPVLQPEFLTDDISEGVRLGDRVRVSLYNEWGRGATGKIVEPPPAIARFGTPWDGLTCRVGEVTYCWVEFDRPQETPQGTHDADQVDARYLESRS